MNTQRGILIVVSSALLHMPIQAAQTNPNHLEPIAPYHAMDTRYRQALVTSLIDESSAFLWMIERGSLAKEYAVMLRGEYDPNGGTHQLLWRGTESGIKWFVEYVAPKERIWPWTGGMMGGMGGMGGGMMAPPEFNGKPTEDVERHRVYIAQDFAEALQEAWRSTLQLTRYGENRVRVQGTTSITEFCYRNDLFGQMFFPRTGLPAMLADLGCQLRGVALSDEKNRESLLAAAESLARKIAKEAEAEQIRVFGKKMSYLCAPDDFRNRDGRGSQAGETD